MKKSLFSDIKNGLRRYRNKHLSGTTLHVLLFILTLLSTYWIGFLGSGLIGGLWYAGGIMLILTAHETGHYLAAKKHGVPATLPFFIPLPLPPFGTLGAVIKMRGYVPNRRALLDIGAAGPLAGLIITIPAIIAGVYFSEITAGAKNGGELLILGDPLIFQIAGRLIHGPLEPGRHILIHPLGYAGWVGLFVTALNLLPVGQLDGGHIVYALFYRKSALVNKIFYSGLVFIFLFFYAGWIVLLVLLAIFRHHPPTIDDSVSLDTKRRVLGFIMLAVFILSFTPVPFAMAGGLIPMTLEWLGL